MSEIANQILELIEPQEAEKEIITDYIESNDLIQFLENYESLNLSEETKEMIEAVKIILDATSL